MLEKKIVTVFQTVVDFGFGFHDTNIPSWPSLETAKYKAFDGLDETIVPANPVWVFDDETHSWTCTIHDGDMTIRVIVTEVSFPCLLS